MANLHKFTVQEAINTDSGGVWVTGSATTVNTATRTVHGSANKDIKGYHTIAITNDQPICFKFKTNTVADVAVAKDLTLDVGTHFLKIPHGIRTGREGETSIYIEMIKAGATNSATKIVLI